ncbi:MAG TPA: hypothetical protein HPP83_08465 [Candidatus Hydrogenedentes bacterium]|nr:hypothetical protein [Candidatus Hydrogenedentota bacterium]
MLTMVYDPSVYSRLETWPLDFAVNVVVFNGIAERRAEDPLFGEEWERRLKLEELQRSHLERFGVIVENAISAGRLRLCYIEAPNSPEKKKFRVTPIDSQGLPILTGAKNLRFHEAHVYRREYVEWLAEVGYSLPKDLRSESAAKESEPRKDVEASPHAINETAANLPSERQRTDDQLKQMYYKLTELQKLLVEELSSDDRTGPDLHKRLETIAKSMKDFKAPKDFRTTQRALKALNTRGLIWNRRGRGYVLTADGSRLYELMSPSQNLS